MNYEGTVWERRDGMRMRIEGDASPHGRMNRSLRAINLVSRRSFWVTPEGIARKYTRVEAAS